MESTHVQRQGFPLPPELILEVAKYLPTIRNLARFTRTCQQTYLVANGELYHTAFSFTPDVRELHFRNVAWCGDTVAIKKMLYALPANVRLSSPLRCMYPHL